MTRCFQKYFLFFFLLVSTTASPQNKQIQEIDKLIDSCENHQGTDDLKLLEHAKRASLIAEQVGNSEKKAIAYFYISKYLNYIGMHKESLAYADKGLNEDAAKKNIILKAKLKEIKGSNYGILGLCAQELEEYFGIINLVPVKNDSDSKRLISGIYAQIAAHYLDKKDYENADKYMDVSLDLSRKTPKEYPVPQVSDLYNIKGYICLERKKEDSAYYFFQKGLEVTDKFHCKYIQFAALGDYYYQTKQYSKSLDYQLKALEDMKAYKMQDYDYAAGINENISKIYGILGNKEKERWYLKQYLKKNETLEEENRDGIRAAANSILNEQLQETSFIRKQSNVLIVSVIVVSFAVVILLYTLYRKVSKKRKNAMQELQIKEKVIVKKDEESKELKQKLALLLEEIKEMAKNNDPVFLVKFQEAFPKFQTNLVKITPNIQNSEITLLAYIYLNFQTKEIADYTFKSTKTIQNRKHILRKKLGIASSEDIYVWLKTNCA